MDTLINDAGLEIIKSFEGLVDGNPNTPGLDPYLDCVDVPTIGWGSTYGLDGHRVTMDHRAISEAEAGGLLTRHIRETEVITARLLRVPVTVNQWSALVSLAYNIGTGNFQSSTLRMKLNRQDYVGAAGEFWKWRRGGGEILPGLVRRREEERRLFCS